MEGNWGQELGTNSGSEVEGPRTKVLALVQGSRDTESGQNEILNEAIEKAIYHVRERTFTETYGMLESLRNHRVNKIKI